MCKKFSQSLSLIYHLSHRDRLLKLIEEKSKFNSSEVTFCRRQLPYVSQLICSFPSYLMPMKDVLCDERKWRIFTAIITSILKRYIYRSAVILKRNFLLNVLIMSSHEAIEVPQRFRWNIRKSICFAMSGELCRSEISKISDRECSEDEFTCNSDGACLPSVLFCDGYNTCRCLQYSVVWKNKSKSLFFFISKLSNWSTKETEVTSNKFQPKQEECVMF